MAPIALRDALTPESRLPLVPVADELTIPAATAFFVQHANAMAGGCVEGEPTPQALDSATGFTLLVDGEEPEGQPIEYCEVEEDDSETFIRGRRYNFDDGLPAGSYLLRGTWTDADGAASIDVTTTLVVVGQADDDPGVLTVLHPFTGGAALDGLRTALAAFTAATGIEVDESGTDSLDELARERIDDGDPPDIIIHPDARLLFELIDDGVALPQTDAVNLAQLRAQMVDGLVEFGEVDGELYGLVLGVSLKSLVWYRPSVFSAGGYAVPTSWSQLVALSEQMISDGHTPWCIGIESGPATGWVATDWLEDIMLRLHGGATYDAWVANELAFDSPEVREAIASYLDVLWFGEGMVAGGAPGILETSFIDAPQGLFDGRCLLHRQASFVESFFPPPDFNPSGTVTRGQMASFLARALDLAPDASVTFGDVPADATHAEAISAIAAAGITRGLPPDIAAFVLPTISGGQTAPVLLSGFVAAAYTDAPAAAEFFRYFARPASGEPLAAAGAWLSPFSSFDVTAYGSPSLAAQGQLVASAAFARFDGSDLMPPEVSAAFFTEMAAYVQRGGTGVDALLTNIDAAWPD